LIITGLRISSNNKEEPMKSPPAARFSLFIAAAASAAIAFTIILSWKTGMALCLLAILATSLYLAFRLQSHFSSSRRSFTEVLSQIRSRFKAVSDVRIQLKREYIQEAGLSANEITAIEDLLNRDTESIKALTPRGVSMEGFRQRVHRVYCKLGISGRDELEPYLRKADALVYCVDCDVIEDELSDFFESTELNEGKNKGF
jgi:hypothetical protein